ncbi:UPF0259 family protein [Xenorhabdus sp. 42]|uniref:YciC family protein n=1 Tax=Xenorhabdus szentirmaii TaxID=290112 RepID=UPI0019CD96FC|nr:YciC family protein [Xenorhabdus sp. 42]MBD2821279.1 UPF0259 family protein [Xenorhabdus sp. 42]
MPITANTLFRDTFNFFKNHLLSMIILSVLGALMTQLLGHFILSNEAFKQMIEMQNSISGSNGQGLMDEVTQLPPEQQYQEIISVLPKVFAINIFGLVILKTSVLSFIKAVSNAQQANAIHAYALSVPRLPKMFLLTFMCTLLVGIGLSFLFLPGIIILFGLSLAPISLFEKNKGIFSAMRESWSLAFNNMGLLLPVFSLFLAVNLILLLIRLPFPIITLTLSNLVTALFLVYLFRLYMLVAPKNQVTNNI